VSGDGGSPCAPRLFGSRSIFADGRAIGHVEPTSSGFVASLASGVAIGTYPTEREAVVAVHDHARRERISRALA
jgi:hypothetical protein